MVSYENNISPIHERSCQASIDWNIYRLAFLEFGNPWQTRLPLRLLLKYKEGFLPLQR